MASLGLATAANAAPIFVGSWDVYSAGAPYWDDFGVNGPLAYTGQEAAALLERMKSVEVGQRSSSATLIPHESVRWEEPYA